MPTIVKTTAKANSEVSMEDVNIITLFSRFYHTCIRQEADFTNDLMVGHLKRFGMYAKYPVYAVFEATEDEFERLLNVCRQISQANPKVLSVDENVSYGDPLDKRIGKHFFIGNLNHDSYQQISEFVTKYFPNEPKN